MALRNRTTYYFLIIDLPAGLPIITKLLPGVRKRERKIQVCHKNACAGSLRHRTAVARDVRLVVSRDAAASGTLWPSDGQDTRADSLPHPSL